MVAVDPLARVVEELGARAAAVTPAALIVGLAGPVAVGKSTIARELAETVGASGSEVRVVSTDSFLLPNDVLAERGLLLRKGFPESYDTGAAVAVLAALKTRHAATVGVYSHATYDVVGSEEVAPADVVLVEGVVALQEPIVAMLDLALYLDAPEDDVREWFVERFLRHIEEARGGAESFYAQFVALDEVRARELAEATWDGINAVNLHEHIAPSRARADLVLTKATNHDVVACHAG